MIKKFLFELITWLDLFCMIEESSKFIFLKGYIEFPIMNISTLFNNSLISGHSGSFWFFTISNCVVRIMLVHILFYMDSAYFLRIYLFPILEFPKPKNFSKFLKSVAKRLPEFTHLALNMSVWWQNLFLFVPCQTRACKSFHFLKI